MEWMLYFVIVSSPLTVSGSRPVGSPEECVEIAYEELRAFIKDKAHTNPCLQCFVRAGGGTEVTQLGDTVFVSYETSRKLRKEGWRPTNDVVVMTYVGKPDPKVPSNRQRANRCAWSLSQHAFADRKLAEQRT